MSIFGSILGKIFGHAQATPPADAPVTAPAADGVPPPPTATPTATAAPTSPEVGAPAPAGSPPPVAPVPAQPVDVDAVLREMASCNPQRLNWQSSIVDLMKLLDLDSSLQSRTALAHELHYTGDPSDSATMNIWLHKEVMQKLEENGGKVPAELKG